MFDKVRIRNNSCSFLIYILEFSDKTELPGRHLVWKMRYSIGSKKGFAFELLAKNISHISYGEIEYSKYSDYNTKFH